MLEFGKVVVSNHRGHTLVDWRSYWVRGGGSSLAGQGGNRRIRAVTVGYIL